MKLTYKPVTSALYVPKLNLDDWFFYDLDTDIFFLTDRIKHKVFQAGVYNCKRAVTHFNVNQQQVLL